MMTCEQPIGKDLEMAEVYSKVLSDHCPDGTEKKQIKLPSE
jgi:hypothetical protein